MGRFFAIYAAGKKPAATTEPDASLPDSSLPEVTAPAAVPRARVRRNPALAVLFFLLLAAVLLLISRSVEIRVEPQPDRVTLRGMLPLLHVGNRYFGVKGTYRLHAVKAGYQDLQADVAIGASEPARYTYTMERMPALLSVTGTPETVEVFLDGESLGPTPLVDTEVSSGPHELVCKAAHYLDGVHAVDLPAGGRLAVDCALEPAR